VLLLLGRLEGLVDGAFDLHVGSPEEGGRRGRYQGQQRLMAKALQFELLLLLAVVLLGIAVARVVMVLLLLVGSVERASGGSVRLVEMLRLLLLAVVAVVAVLAAAAAAVPAGGVGPSLGGQSKGQLQEPAARIIEATDIISFS
jgi:hypothetical protein